MKILTVIPIARGITADTLTYFTKSDVGVGAIVSVPLRKKSVYGLVTGSREAKEIKSELKSLDYSIRKVERIETKGFLSESFITSAEKIADYNACSIGAVLSILIPNAILESNSKTSPAKKDKPKDIFHEILLLQSDDEERFATYRALVREEFAKNRSVFFCLPTIEDILSAKNTLEKGIENYTYVLHSELPKKELVSLWQKIIHEQHPILLIATGSFLSLPREDFGTIILDKESSRGYKMQVRPYLDIRTVAENVAKENNIRLVLGDIFLRIETLWKEKEGEYAQLSPLKFRSLSPANLEICDIRAPADMKKKEFTVLGERLKNILAEASENNEHTFLFCGRKGLYPQTVCSDCGTLVTCKNCNAPMVLYGPGSRAKLTTGQGKPPKDTKNLFVCHHCGERRDAHELCKHCGGWRLLPLGIGIERVLEEVRNLLPDAVILVMDKDHVSTHKQAVKLRDQFYGSPGAILLGTEMALPYLAEKVENTAVVSLDSFFSIPDFQIHEKIFHILLSLRALAEKNMIIQTRREDKKIFEYAARGNLVDFYRDETEERKAAGFPPFATFIKISLSGEKSAVKKKMEEAVSILKPFELQTFDAWNPGSKSAFTMHGLISLPRGDWPEKILLEKLRELSPQFSIRIDPDTLL